MELTLKAARVNAGMTQADIAQLVGVTKQTVSNWECGYNAPTAYKLKCLCNLYGVKMDDVILPKALKK